MITSLLKNVQWNLKTLVMCFCQPLKECFSITEILFFNSLIFPGCTGSFCCTWACSSCGAQAPPRCRDFLLWSTGQVGCAGSVVVVHGPSCSETCGIFPDKGSNLCPPIGRWILDHWTTKDVPDIFSLETCISFFFFFIEVQLIYNVVLVSGTQQSDSAIHTCISIFSQILFSLQVIKTMQ